MAARFEVCTTGAGHPAHHCRFHGGQVRQCQDPGGQPREYAECSTAFEHIKGWKVDVIERYSSDSKYCSINVLVMIRSKNGELLSVSCSVKNSIKTIILSVHEMWMASKCQQHITFLRE
jgi:hypothetical protein